MSASGGWWSFDVVQAWPQRGRWHARAAAFALGAASILSMAPFFLWGVLWLTLPVLLWLMQHAEDQPERRARFAPWQRLMWGRAAETGWWFGFGYHVFGLFWIGEAFLVEAEIFAWLLPFAVTLLPAGLALFTAVACGFAAWAAPAGFWRVVALALGFGVTEWLRGHIFTGLPWNVLGYALTSPSLIQSAAQLGIYGLTIVTVLMFAGAPALWRAFQRVPAVMLGTLPLLIFGYTTLSARAYTPASTAGLPVVRIVQPSVPQREKWRPENQRTIFDDHLALSLQAADGKSDNAAKIALVVWPEAAMPFLALNEPVALREIGQMLPPRTTLITGALRAEPPAQPGGNRRVFNSLLVFGHGESAAVHAVYDKTHLVPFGEYLPLQRFLEAIGLQQLSRLRGGFAAGPEPRQLLDVPSVGRLAPLICYESIFPGRVIQTQERPRALVMITNDGWFGNTTGPRQHLHMARVRAVEEGVPVIRAANNGISAMIGSYGEFIGQPLALNVRGTIDALLPPAVSPPLYARLGDTLFAVLVGLLGIALVGSKRRM